MGIGSLKGGQATLSQGWEALGWSVGNRQGQSLHSGVSPVSIKVILESRALLIIYNDIPYLLLVCPLLMT